ncbi:MAG: cysteine synthase [Myxococcaceae bacterium]|nr:cysteine synthase [Myxococcaceae bacterium]
MIDEQARDTPVVKLQRLVPAGCGAVWLKLETRSPNATVMDRVARHLARAAADGDGDGVWRAAADGALAVAVAMQGALRGRAVEAYLPEDTPLEVRQSLITYGAKVILTPFAGGGAGALAAARQAGEVLSDRFPGARPEAMAEVGRELLAALDRIDAFVAPVATGATLSAIGRLLRAKFPQVLLVAVRPFGEAWRPHRQHGVLPQELTLLLDPGLVSSTEWVDDLTAWKMRERLGREEGLLLSAGTAAGVEAACRVAQALGPDARVCALAADTGERSFSVAEQL